MNSISRFDTSYGGRKDNGYGTRNGGGPRRPAAPARTSAKSFVHYAALFLVWLAVATSSIVFAEPGPVDVLTVGLMILLPAIGLTRFMPGLGAPLCLLLVFCAAGFFATTLTTDVGVALKHNVVTLYLCATSILFAVFVAYKPREHTELLLNAYLVAALIAALAGIVGIFSLFPGAEDLFTKFGRARGTFKDPNVFGPFLVPALVYSVHLLLTRSARMIVPSLAFIGILSAATLLSLSRGAWIGAALAVGLYLYLFFIFAPRDIERIKVIALSLFGAVALVGLIAGVVQTDQVGDLLTERTTLTQPYDEGPEGRFGGQLKAFDLIQENPFGIGALEFTEADHHHENAHNTFLTLFLSNGWLGGFAFLILTFGTLGFGFRHALRRTPVQPLFLIVFASLVAIMLEAVIIDIDHWRHFFLLLGIVWGLMASDVVEAKPDRISRIVRDLRPKLLRPVVTVGPIRRLNRIIRKLPRRIELPTTPTKRKPKLVRQTGHAVGKTYQPCQAMNASELVKRYRAAYLQQRQTPRIQ